jgi:transcriptional regulator with XRE-family HTH domain
VKKTKRTVIVVDNSALARRIGARLRKARLQAGLTQGQVAEGRYTPAYISALERGLAKPSMAALTFIAERVGVPTEQFVADAAELNSLRLEADIALAAGEFRRAIDLYTQLLDRQPDGTAKAEIQVGMAEALCRVDRGPEALSLAAAAAEFFAGTGKHEQAALAHYWMAYGHYQQDNLDQAGSILADLRRRVSEGLQVAPDFRFRLLTAIANVESRRGEDQRALSYLHEAEALTGQLELRKRAIFLAGLAISYRESGDFEASINAGTQSLALHRAAHSVIDQATLSNNLALTYLKLGSLDRAAQLAESAAEIADSEQERRLLAHIRETQSQVALARNDLVGAREFADAAIDLAAQSGNAIAAATATQTLGALALRDGDTDSAVAAYGRAVELMRELNMPARLQDALGQLAQLMSERGDLAAGNRLYAEALATRRR